MEVEQLKSKKDKTCFILKKSTPGFANALRRAMIDEVPTMAIETVEISKNSGILYDEILAHRLGLLILKTDLKSYNLPDKCTCKGEGCAQCQLKLTLKAKGNGYVYAEDIKSTDPKVTPVFEKTIITKLLKGQDLELEATAVLGRGKQHVKFSPGFIYYKHPVEIKVKSDSKDVEQVVKSCPMNIFEDKKGKISINKDKVATCHLCNGCVDISQGNVTIEEQDDQFLFTMEPWGQLDSKTIIKKSVEIIQEKCDEFISKLK